MSVETTRACVVLTANEDCLERIEAFCQTESFHQYALTLRHYADPLDLLTVEAQQPHPALIAILDFTAPVASAHRRVQRFYDSAPTDGRKIFLDENACKLAWQVGAVAAEQALRHVPMLIASDTPLAETILREYHLAPVERIPPSADTALWQRTVSHLLSGVSLDARSDDVRHQRAVVEVPETALQLSSTLWFDAGRGALLEPNGRGIVTLSPQEHYVLTVLARMPHRFVDKRMLMLSVENNAGYAIDSHCLEQTICGLRRKLGESARAPRLLLSRRRLGYALCPQTQQPAIVTSRRAAHAH